MVTVAMPDGGALGEGSTFGTPTAAADFARTQVTAARQEPIRVSAGDEIGQTLLDVTGDRDTVLHQIAVWAAELIEADHRRAEKENPKY
ncbi:hypothetical protein [Nocardia gipuzkoensis]